MLHRKIYTVAAGAALALALQACSGSTSSEEPAKVAATTPAVSTPAAATSAGAAAEKPSATPTRSKSDTEPGGTGAADPILAGKRQVVIKPVQSTESIVALDKGRLTTIDGEAEHTLFVLSPTSGKFLIKTAKVVSGGEPLCLVIKTNGSNPLTVGSAACDAGKADQLFTIDAVEGKNYSIANGDAFLQLSGKYGIIAQELGDAPLTTTFNFVDNGASTLPKLGD
ncbi:hypothetical protein [Actinoplanes utahensis]|uniref:Ricin B lectin domain-containing protein n=1 Tax=Actinoplanes utahensis TaxID=1869 RepID=A0A0A6UIF4_ACTUT|nr:hypothetical protein [Actinoplanes utahensis]KHD74833.1 hypothetical protein MB27_26165 [Actinoplanes utahensis]GIF30807.1 hypothetical protein Aut01nite_37930 [Actinoplanes utahensis]